MKEVFIIDAKRTPIGSFGGQFNNTSAVDLGVASIKGILKNHPLLINEIDELFFGQVCQANAGQSPARQLVIKSGLSNTIPATTINKVCASGMKATIFGAQMIQLNQADLIISGGMENMSQIPFYLGKARFGYGFGNNELVDGLSRDGLTDVYDHVAMGCFADATADKFSISREQQDAYAIQSYKRATLANEKGDLSKEIVSVEMIDRKGDRTEISEDEEFKKVMYEKIPTLRPVFSKTGTVTAANASTINDGAAALLLASEEAVKKHDLKPLAKIVSYADAAHEPKWFTTAPILSTEKALKRANLTLEEIDYFEVNEAFSVVPLAFAKNFGITEDILNIYGGAVSLGHPLGCSGARILTTLLNILQNKNAKRGLAAICNGGGGASSMIVEMI